MAGLRPFLAIACVLAALVVALDRPRPPRVPVVEPEPAVHVPLPEPACAAPATPAAPVTPRGDDPLVNDLAAALNEQARTVKEVAAGLKAALGELRKEASRPAPVPSSPVPIVVNLPAPPSQPPVIVSLPAAPAPAAQAQTQSLDQSVRPVLRELSRLSGRIDRLAQALPVRSNEARGSAQPIRPPEQPIDETLGAVVVGAPAVAGSGDGAVGLAAVCRLVSALTRRVEALEKRLSGRPWHQCP